MKINEINKGVSQSKSGFSIKEMLNKDVLSFNTKLKDKDKERFYSELNILLSSGIDIRTALEIIVEEQSKKADKFFFEQIKDAIIMGSSFSAALNATGKFTNYEYFSLQIGEESGKLTNVLNELALYYNRKIKQKRKLISTLTYPSIILFSSFMMIYFMMIFVVPMFVDIFKRFKGELPIFTRVVIKISYLVENYSIYFLIILLGLIFFVYSQRNRLWYRKFSSTFLMKIPVFNELIAKIYLARFCQSMSLLLSSKTPLVQTINLAKNMVGYYPIESSLTVVESDILKGEPLYKSLMKFTVFNKRMISLIKVAEEVNQLDIMFEKIGKQYSDEVEYKTNMLGNVIEPLILIFLGAIVGFILIAIYLPMIQMGNVIG